MNDDGAPKADENDDATTATADDAQADQPDVDAAADQSDSDDAGDESEQNDAATDDEAEIHYWKRISDGRVEKAFAGGHRDERFANHADWYQVDASEDPAALVPAQVAISGGRGGWYEVHGPDAVERIQGREAAVARAAELAEEATTSTD